jgi:arginyl-tRNA synthetase
MFKELVLNDTLEAIKQAISHNELGQMSADDEVNISSEKPKNADFGDFAVNVSSLARSARIAPPMIANAIVKYLPTENYTTSVVAGFINFKLSDKILSNVIKEILEKLSDYGKPEKINKERINLEYVSANPTGPFHIGHGRWAAMGSSLANLLKFYGHDVYQEFYINDAGSQIQKLGRSLNIRIKQELGEKIDFPEDEEERKIIMRVNILSPLLKSF